VAHQVSDRPSRHGPVRPELELGVQAAVLDYRPDAGDDLAQGNVQSLGGIRLPEAFADVVGQGLV
jgi:hypothetical protein